ncbi:MAG TPA: hypothetical protein VGN83_11960 [Falsiroseomonas sp.]|nr:hypothetical protein [Falsiroseomonas sp.]
MPRPLCRKACLLGLICLLAAGLCVGVAVQADLDPAPIVAPYDPLPHW